MQNEGWHTYGRENMPGVAVSACPDAVFGWSRLLAPAGAPIGYPTANSRFVGKSCKNCHVNLHGSNSPSGAYFVR